MFDLYLITDPDAPGGVVEVTRAALEGATPGRVAVQLRAKALGDDALHGLGNALREVTAARGVPLLVNGRPDVARAVGADGVHLPEGATTPRDVRAILGEGALVGVSCHDPQGLTRAAQQGASFATLSPLFTVPGKGPALGEEGFRHRLPVDRPPVLALGGIGPREVDAALTAGADGVAVIRAVYGSEDPAGAVADLLRALDAARRVHPAG